MRRPYNRMSTAVVAELERDAEILFAQLPHRFLQVVFRG